MSFSSYDIPPQENKGKWFRSHLLGREIELGELYSLGSNELDLLMAETAEITVSYTHLTLPTKRIV